MKRHVFFFSHHGVATEEKVENGQERHTSLALVSFAKQRKSQMMTLEKIVPELSEKDRL
jgi:hypothetical protein